MEKQIRIKDKKSGRFIVDDVILNGYGKRLGASGIALYVVLCRFANNKSQSCYPSLSTIEERTGMIRRTILRAADKLEKLGLIEKKVKKGRFTIYTLLEPPVSNKHQYPNDTGIKKTLKRCHLDTQEVSNRPTNELRKRNLDKTNLDIVKYNPQSLKLAKLLYELIKKENPAWYLKPNWDKWAEDIDKIVRIDGRTYEQIEFMINWVQQDDFWK